MTKELREHIPKIFFAADGFLYGNNWLGTLAYYKATYPGFKYEQTQVLEMYSNGVSDKQYKKYIEKTKEKDQECFELRSQVNSSSKLLNFYAIHPSTSNSNPLCRLFLFSWR